jgi:CheY-like chemotaxis protein
MSVQLETAPARPANVPATNGRPDAGVREDADGLRCAKEVRILVIDDDEDICRVVEAALCTHDFQIRTVSDPAEVEGALQTSPTESYHLIILDYVLPGLESDQVFGWLRDNQPDASIIVITGYPSIDSALKCLRHRIYDYLTKPFQVGQLKQVAMRCLEGKGLLRMSEEALRESLGSAIRERRKTLGLTLAQMAARTDVSLGYLSQIELGKNSASIETLYRICLALGIKMAELFQAVHRPL